MLKIYIDRETEYIDIDFDIMFDADRFAITGNREYTEYTDASWYEKTTNVLKDLDSDTFTGESFRFYPDITRDQRKSLLTVYEDCRSIDDPETIARAANILFPACHFELHTLRGSVQREWQYIIIDAEYAKILETLSDFYFGYVAELHIEDGDDDTWDYISNTELWSIERAGNLKQELLNRYGYPIDTPCELYESDGYTRTKRWKTA